MHTNKTEYQQYFLYPSSTFLYFAVKSVKHGLFLFLKEFLLHCTSEFSYLSLNVLLVDQTQTVCLILYG